MLRLRFLPGLLVGLLIGLPLGFLVALQALPARTGDSERVQDLTARLERAERDKETLNRQLDDFRIMAERMTASFSDLERRFKGLEADVHHGELTPSASPGTSPAPPEQSTPAS